ncbi:hypothetical protein IFM89_038466 [Coptis chinensis]|uniref:Uncharacterized protein n=1 Tax=Coptis chinensis TaxID=261450 RepID=A0A835LKW3_9MAGN|nr:hypothetical protein IFM89_038466 [Coptis chinensis]
MDYTNLLLFLSFVCLCICIVSSTATRLRRANLPPGPLPLPIFGNLFKLGSKPHRSLAELAKVHGPLMTLKLGSVTTVVVSSPTLAKDILQTHDQSFASRNIPEAVRALKHHELSMAWLPALTQWRNIRKMCNTQLFVMQRLEFSQALRRQKVEELLAYVDENCEHRRAVDIGQVAFSTVLNLISNTVFSADLTRLDSNYAQEFKALVRGVMEEAAKPNLADYFPILRSFDPQGIRRRMENYFRKLDDLFDGMIKKRLDSRQLEASPSCHDFLDTILDYKQDDFQLSDPDIKALLKDIFVAGTDTTSSTLEWAMTELLRNPNKMVKAQLELEEVFGKDKPIDESDIIGLPYLQAIVKETFRLHPPVPLLLPHKAVTNVNIGDFTVPQHTQVLINVWTIGRDSSIWENPSSFVPERFLNSGVDFKGRDFTLIPFGAGRRICPGLPLAFRMVYLMLASLLHAFDWKLEEGISPEDIDMEENFGLALQKAKPLKAIPIKNKVAAGNNLHIPGHTPRFVLSIFYYQYNDLSFPLIIVFVEYNEHGLIVSWSAFIQPNPNSKSSLRSRKKRLGLIMAVGSTGSSNTTRLVTFLGKGGSGKTTSAVLVAQFYANAGLKTCLVTHSQDPTVEYLMGCKIGTSPTMLLGPLNQLKQADARLKLTQGVLEGVVGEELGVLPGMDSIFAALELNQFVGFLGMTATKRNQPQSKFDIIIYDGVSNEETLRMIGMTEKARWYLKYLRNIAEKTDVGRLTAPSLLRLVDEVLRLNGTGGLRLNGKMSGEIWDDIDRILERASGSFLEPSKFGCYLMIDPNSPTSVKSALRYWGCAIQSGAQVSGAFGLTTKQSCAESAEMIHKSFSPLPSAFMPYLSTNSPIDFDAVVFREDLQHLLSTAASSGKVQSSVEFNHTKKSVTLFIPGFDKSEIKLYQYRGGSELLVEAGDQRRVIRLPSSIQGKVGGAKFTDKSLLITMR